MKLIVVLFFLLSFTSYSENEMVCNVKKYQQITNNHLPFLTSEDMNKTPFKDLIGTGYVKLQTALFLPYLSTICSNILKKCKDNNQAIEATKCYWFADIMTTLLGASKQTLSSRLVYFSDEMKRINNDTKLINYLKDLEKRLENNDHFNLWDFTFLNRNIQRDGPLALLTLATIFQDKEYETSVLSPDIEMLKDKIIAKVWSRIERGTLDGYPRGVNINKPEIYHFYVIGYLAYKMRKRNVPREYAFATPYALNTTYEEVMKNLSGKLSYEDIYSGYAGIAFTFGQEKSGKFTGKSFEEFKESYIKNTVADEICSQIKKAP